jgi:putative transposase
VADTSHRPQIRGYPFTDSNMLRELPSQQGLEVARRHVRTLMRRMVIETIYSSPSTSQPAPGHKISPYLLGGMASRAPIGVDMDITYIPTAHGFVYLAAVVNCFSRKYWLGSYRFIGRDIEFDNIVRPYSA